jgi:hypothetical protein
MGTMATLAAEPTKRREFRQAIADRQSKTQDFKQSDKMKQMMAETDQPMSDQQQRKWTNAMRGMKFDDRPDQWIDRLLREPELPPASLEITPALEAELREKLTARLPSTDRAERLLERIRLTFDRNRGEPFFVTVTMEYSGEASLSWYLTTQERGDILASAAKLKDRIDLLKAWWLAPSAQDGVLDAYNVAERIKRRK